MSKRKTVLPGHMKKAIERIEEIAPAVDLVLEVVDARAPESSRCKILTKILAGSHHVKVISKTDLADPAVTREWKKRFDEDSTPWTELPFGRKISSEKFLTGIKLPGHFLAGGAMIKALAIGIPNVGKSTLINLLVGRRTAHVGAKPGITRGLQLLKVHEGVFIYDTPGVINPVIKSDEHACVLGLIGCLQEHFFDIEQASYYLAGRILAGGASEFEKHYGLELTHTATETELIDALARRRGFILKGGEPDFARACRVLASDFATGRFKGISLESPG